MSAPPSASMVETPPQPARRRSIDETRQLLLEKGMELINERGVRIGVEHISLIDVCRRAGMRTAGSGYKIWPAQAEFRADLVSHLAGQISGALTIPMIVETALAVPRTKAGLRELIRVASAADMEHFAETGHESAYLALWCAAPSDSELEEAVLRVDRESTDNLAQMYQAMADHFGIRWVAPFNARLFATTVVALADGLTICGRYGPAPVPTDLPGPTLDGTGTEPWHLYGLLIEAIVQTFGDLTGVPDTDPDARSAALDDLPRHEPGEATTSSAPAPVSADHAPPRHRGRRRRSLEDTRELLLDTGVAMLAEEGVSVGIEHISLLDASERAGMTSAGSGYKIWPTQDDYRADLLRELVKWIPSAQSIPEIFEMASTVPRSPSGLRELIRRGTAYDAPRSINDTERFATYLAVWSAAGHDPELADAVRADDGEALAGVTAFYEGIAEEFGMEWVPPFNSELMAVAATALSEGFALRHRHDPAAVPTDLPRPTADGTGTEPWHLFGCAIEAIVKAYGRPKS